MPFHQLIFIFACVNPFYEKHIKHTACCICESINAQGINMRSHVTLVNPPYPKGAHQHPPFTPLGLGYLAAVLEKNRCEVDVIDCQALNISFEEVKSAIIDDKAIA
jgi:hypothetical protein